MINTIKYRQQLSIGYEWTSLRYFCFLLKGDMLHYHNDMMFSTRDQDNDAGERMCANLYYGAWWYNDCYHSNPNGKYIGSNKSDATSMNWNWENVHESLQTTRLMIRSEPS